MAHTRVLVVRHRGRYHVVDNVDVGQNVESAARDHLARSARSTRSRATALLVAHNKAARSKPSHGVCEIDVLAPNTEVSEYVKSKMVNGVYCPTPDLCPSPPRDEL